MKAELEKLRKVERQLTPDNADRTRLVVRDLNNLRAKQAKWAEEHPEESKMSVVCTHVLFPVEKDARVDVVRFKLSTERYLTNDGQAACNGIIYMCNGCAIIYTGMNAGLFPPGNFQLVKWKDFHRNLNKAIDR